MTTRQQGTSPVEMAPHSDEPETVRFRVTVQGVVQGVGFRPFVHRLAAELGLAGHVSNGPDGVTAEVEGAACQVRAFRERIRSDAPPLAVVSSVAAHALPPEHTPGFTIRPSEPAAGEHRSAGQDFGRTLPPPDTAVCTACLAEMNTPGDRRHRHPFITCTDCGPRFTLVTGLPYDRVNTTMAGFAMCDRCAAEYADPGDRRFHAQPVACAECGPRLRLTTAGAGPELDGEPAISRARELLAAGSVIAVKGIGGYHLACDALSQEAVARLRKRKERGGKPFAVMAADLDTAAAVAPLSAAERRLLEGPRRPIVLVRRGPVSGREPLALADAVCAGSPDVGVMLPYAPVHHLLFGLVGDAPGPGVLVMTSGNRSGEPIAADEAEARARLSGIADAWLSHDRGIRAPCDDSVMRARADGSTAPVRRSRGHVPEGIPLPFAVPPALAVGGDLKNAFCLAAGRHAWLSAHIGDLDQLATLRAYEKALDHMSELTGVRPGIIAADQHPSYRSTRWAKSAAEGRPVHLVQHHHAHIASAMAEAGLDGSTPVIGVAFDGTGFGDDGAVWGGEFLLADYAGYRRLSHLAYVPLPGGDAAVRNPYRMALSHLRAAGIGWDPDLPCVAQCPEGERRVIERQLERNLACVPTSAMGRLFDAVSSLLGVCHHAGYEAQAAIELEAHAAREWGDRHPGYSFGQTRHGAQRLLSPAPVLRSAVTDLRAGTRPGAIAARFHRAVAGAVTDVCRDARRETGVDAVALTGGVFNNALLDEECAQRLRADGFTVVQHRTVPCGDGGLALGQLLVAARQEGAGTPDGPPDTGGHQRRTDHDTDDEGGAHVPGSARPGGQR